MTNPEPNKTMDETDKKIVEVSKALESFIIAQALLNKSLREKIKKTYLNDPNPPAAFLRSAVKSSEVFALSAVVRSKLGDESSKEYLKTLGEIEKNTQARYRLFMRAYQSFQEALKENIHIPASGLRCGRLNTPPASSKHLKNQVKGYQMKMKNTLIASTILTSGLLAGCDLCESTELTKDNKLSVDQLCDGICKLSFREQEELTAKVNQRWEDHKANGSPISSD